VGFDHSTLHLTSFSAAPRVSLRYVRGVNGQGKGFPFSSLSPKTAGCERVGVRAQGNHRRSRWQCGQPTSDDLLLIWSFSNRTVEVFIELAFISWFEMECIICGESRKSKGSLFRADGSAESVGVICTVCYRNLLSNRPTSMGCGFPTEGSPCEREAIFGTGSLERTRQPGDVEPSGSIRNIDDLLLCEEHLREFKSGTQPPWRRGGFR